MEDQKKNEKLLFSRLEDLDIDDEDFALEEVLTAYLERISSRDAAKIILVLLRRIKGHCEKRLSDLADYYMTRHCPL